MSLDPELRKYLGARPEDVRPADRAREADLAAFADAVARATPCSCSAQRARAEKAEAERDALDAAQALAMSALTAALTTMQEAARLPEGHEDDADLLHETVALLPVQIDRLTQERDELRERLATLAPTDSDGGES